jgi:hypothetical protein
MTPTELLSDVFTRSTGMVNMTLADFSDAEMMMRPVPGANHATWQIGHLTGAHAGLLNMIGEGLVQGPPAEFAAKFKKDTCTNDDAKFFPKKADLLAEYNKVCTAIAAWIKTLKTADLEKPSTGRMVDMAPTAGHVLSMLTSHNMMHMGQFQVLRRKLGKPILF